MFTTVCIIGFRPFKQHLKSLWDCGKCFSMGFLNMSFKITEMINARVGLRPGSPAAGGFPFPGFIDKVKGRSLRARSIKTCEGK